MKPVVLLLAVVAVAGAAVLALAPFGDEGDDAGQCIDEVGAVISCKDSEALYVTRPAGARGCSAESRAYASSVRREAAERLDDAGACLHLIER